MKRALTILAYFFACTVSSAQEYPFVHYTPKDGLVNSRVKKAYQDSKGRMYFLTYGGLSVYDGARFKNYTSQNGLAMNVVNDILEIGDDSFLVATNSASINLLAKGRMELLKSENGSTPLINQFYRHTNGRIYLSSDFGLFMFEKNKIQVLNISGIPTSHGQFNLGNITGFDNYLVITTNEMSSHKGCFLYDIKNNRICDSLTSLWAILAGKDWKNRIWIITSQKLLVADTIAMKNGKLSLLSPDNGYQQTANFSTINIAFGYNLAWFVYRNELYRNSELRRIDEGGNLLRIHLPGKLTASYIQSIFIDRENSIWLCNDGEGVFKIARSRLQILDKPFGDIGEGQARFVYYNNGVTWFSTISKMLFRTSSADSKSFTCDLPQSPFIFWEKGRTIFANDPHYIYRADLPDKPGKINFRKIISLDDSDVFGDKVILDPYGAIIAGQQNGISVWLKTKRIYYQPVGKYEHIENLFFDNNKRLWVVTRSNGIFVFSLHPENFAGYLQSVFHIPQDQLDGSVRSFVMDKSGLIWVGTREFGLVAYRLKGTTLHKLFHFDVTNGLTDNFVTSLACDSLNNIIAGTQSGLDLIIADSAGSYRVENTSKNGNFFAYIQKTWADATHGYALTNSGVVLRVTSSGIYDPVQSPQLILIETKVNAKTVLQPQNLFSYKENNISFLVAAPSFVDEKQIRYTYLLEGSGNNRWSDTTAANSIINLTNLSSGTYVLKVKSFFHSDVYLPSEMSYSFEITPPWWRAWWFRSLVGLALTGLLIIVLRFYYGRKLERQMATIERQRAIEKERTRIATDMHDDLGAGLSRIKFLSQALSNKGTNDEGAKIALEKITGYSDEMSEKMGEIVWALNERNDTLADLIAYTRSYAVEYLTNHNIQCDANTPMSLPATFIQGEMRRNIFLAVKECLHNVVKHANASRVLFSVVLSGNIEITIHDNGKGIDPKNQRKFSNGLENIVKRMKEINGKASFLNDNGTKVLLSMPLVV